jgi:hypothetical protein
MYLERSDADKLETLVHEQIHLFQEMTATGSKTGGYHNKAFIEKATEIGLKAMPGRGCHLGPPGNPFVALLKAYGISFDPRSQDVAAPLVGGAKTRPHSRLRRWACACKAVWCGGTLEAMCLRCEQRFELTFS